MKLYEKYLDKKENKENLVNEVMGYKIKPKDKKIILAFINGATRGEGNSLWIEGDYLYGPYQSTPNNAVAQRANGKIITGQAYGNVSQTWKNFIMKHAGMKYSR